MVLQQPERLAQWSRGHMGRGGCSHRLLERQMAETGRRQRRRRVGDAEHREHSVTDGASCPPISHGLCHCTLHPTQTMFEPVFMASYCSRIQGQGVWKWEAGADVGGPTVPARGQRDVLPTSQAPSWREHEGEQPDSGLSLALDHMETKLQGSGAGERGGPNQEGGGAFYGSWGDTGPADPQHPITLPSPHPCYIY